MLLLQKCLGLGESNPAEAMKRLESTRGALVPMPLDFLKEERDLLPKFGTTEYVAPGMLFKWHFTVNNVMHDHDIYYVIVQIHYAFTLQFAVCAVTLVRKIVLLQHVYRAVQV